MRGRKRLSDRPVLWHIHIPESIADKYTLLFTDPLTGEIKRGARSALITQLLREHWQKLGQNAAKTSLDN